MATKNLIATIGRKTDPNNGHVTLYIKDHPWGPIVTGKTLEEAKAKFLLALPANMVANSYCELYIHADKPDDVKKAVEAKKDERIKLEEELEDELEEDLEQCV